jgi:hypothetical protein
MGDERSHRLVGLSLLALLAALSSCRGTTTATADKETPPPKPTVSAPPPASVSAKPTSAPEEPKQVDVTEGIPVGVGNGVTITLKNVMEAHLAGGRNESRATLVVSRGNAASVESVEVTLDRLYPGPPKWTKQFGVRLAIDYVDAYHMPATGRILVLAE